MKIKRCVSRLIDEKTKVNSSKIKQECELNVSTSTVQRCMRKIGYRYKKAKTQIVLSAMHKRKRVEYITNWISNNHPWEITVFSDEKRFCLDGPDCWYSYSIDSVTLIRPKRQCGGGSLMLWLMVLPNGLLSYRVIEGIFKAKSYEALLCDMIVPIIKLNLGSNYYFQEDNCSIHKSKAIKSFMINSDIEVLEWPSKSPDINIVEDIWKMISDTVYDGASFRNKSELLSAINKCIFELNSCKRDIIKKLYETFRKRLAIILCKNGELYNKM